MENSISLDKTRFITKSGRHFDYVNVEANIFDITDIAHALSNLCRFGGHSRKFYSVAQHSVIVSYLVPEQYQLEALMHDSAEAFMIDLPTPLKLLLPDYKAIEERVEREVMKRFNLPYPHHPCIKAADDIALVSEKRDLMPTPRGDDVSPTMVGNIKPMKTIIVPLNPKKARNLFLARYSELIAA